MADQNINTFGTVEHTHNETVIHIRLPFTPAKKSVIGSFKVRIQPRNMRRTAYVHQIKLYERKDGQIGYYCAKWCGQKDINPVFDNPCAGIDLAKRIVGEIAKSPETEVADLRQWLKEGGNLDERVSQIARAA